jgi:hypothetical protein
VPLACIGKLERRIAALEAEIVELRRVILVANLAS